MISEHETESFPIPGFGLIAVAGGRAPRSSRLWWQLGRSDEVVGGADEVSGELGSFPALVAGAPEVPDGLHSPNGLFNSFANPLADAVARMSSSPGVDGRAAHGVVLHDMRDDGVEPALVRELSAVVALVGPTVTGLVRGNSSSNMKRAVSRSATGGSSFRPRQLLALSRLACDAPPSCGRAPFEPPRHPWAESS